jgi:hypothetical protein
LINCSCTRGLLKVILLALFLAKRVFEFISSSALNVKSPTESGVSFFDSFNSFSRSFSGSSSQPQHFEQPKNPTIPSRIKYTNAGTTINIDAIADLLSTFSKHLFTFEPPCLAAHCVKTKEDNFQNQK